MGMNLGADDYLTKPFTRTDLLMAVQSRLERSRFMKEFLAAERQEMRRKLLEEIPDRFGNLLNNLMGCFDLLAEEDDPAEKAKHYADGRKAIAELYAIWLANLRAMSSGNGL
jgi:DNA-binding response OmpR family regulator